MGAIWIFTRSGTSWTQEGSKLIGTGETGTDVEYGSSIALSSDGNTLATGAVGNDTGVGATWVFTRSSGVWSQEAGPIIGTGATGAAQQGRSVTLSSDGNTLAVGGYFNDSNKGAVWVFTRSGGVWSQEAGPIVGTGAVGNAKQGNSVSLSTNGNTLVSGGPYDDSIAGAVWIFTRSGGVWSQQGPKLVGSGSSAGTSGQGTAVSISGDGNTIVSTGSNDNNSAPGAAWVFTRTGIKWSQLGFKLEPSSYIGTYADFGFSAALSRDGTTIAVGAIVENTNQGATYIFVPR